MKTHVLKCWPEYFEPVVKKLKTFEIRKNDRGFKVCDLLKLKEWDPSTSTYTGRLCMVQITYMLQLTFIGLQSEYVVLAITVLSTWTEGDKEGTIVE